MWKGVVGVCWQTVGGVGGDSLLIHLCRNLLKVGLQAKGVGSVGRLLLLAYMGGCLTICEACPPCPLSG